MKRFIEVMAVAAVAIALRCTPVFASGEPYDGTWIMNHNIEADAEISPSKIAGTAATLADLAASTNSIYAPILVAATGNIATATARVGLVEGLSTTNAAAIVLLQGLGSTNAGLISAETTYAKPQVDTNVTTTATLKTPRYIGDMLIGSAGSGTGAVWVATVATTNGWLAIKP